MIIVVRIILLILFIILQYYIAKQFESTAADKGYKHSRYFHLCFWFGIVGYILVAALPDRGKDNAKTPNQAYIPNGVVAHMDSPDERSDSDEDAFPAQPIGGTYAIPRGENNIMCTTCRRIQFKGNRVCNKCGATFINIE